MSTASVSDLPYRFGNHGPMNALRRIREARGLTQKQLAALIHTTDVSVSRYEAEDQRLTLPLLRQLADALVCSIAELAGQPEHASTTVGAEADAKPFTPVSRVTPKGMDSASNWRNIAIQELDVRAGAGGSYAMDSNIVAENGELIDTVSVVNEWQVPSEIFAPITKSTSEQLKIITIVGNSMSPDFSPGERVIVDTNDKKPSPPGVFALWDGMAVVVKLVEFVPFSDPPTVRIKSKNPDFAPYERVVDEAYIQGRVFGKWHWT